MKPIDMPVIRGREKTKWEVCQSYLICPKTCLFIYFDDHSFISMNIIGFVYIELHFYQNLSLGIWPKIYNERMDRDSYYAM